MSRLIIYVKFTQHQMKLINNFDYDNYYIYLKYVFQNYPVPFQWQQKS